MKKNLKKHFENKKPFNVVVFNTDTLKTVDTQKFDSISEAKKFIDKNEKNPKLMGFVKWGD